MYFDFDGEVPFLQDDTLHVDHFFTSVGYVSRMHIQCAHRRAPDTAVEP